MKNLKIYLFIITVLTLGSCELNLNSCLNPEGPDETQNIVLDDDNIDEIELNIPVTLFLSEGATQEISITAAPNIIAAIVEDSDTDGNRWEVEISGCSDTDGVTINAQLKALEKLTINGSSVIKSNGDLNNIEDVTVEINGSGVVELELDADKVKGEINGSGTIEVMGTGNESDFKITGSGKIKTHELIVPEAKIDIQGSGKAEIFASDNLEVKIEGSGTVCYKGTPTIDLDVEGSGKVENCN